SSASSSAIRIVMGSPCDFISFLHVLFDGQCHDKYGSLPFGALGRDGAAMPFRDLPAHGQPDSGPFILETPVETLEYLENPVGVLFVEPNSIVLNDNLAKVFSGLHPGQLLLGGDSNSP